MNSKVVRIVDEAPDIKTFVLRPLKGFKYLPGQWMYVSTAKGSDRRQFSISSAPTEKDISFTTKFTGTEFKEKLWQLGEGDNLEIEGAFGNFCLNKPMFGPQLFLCGGMGVTPFRSIYRYLFDTNATNDIVLLYSNRNKSDTVFEKEFRMIAEKQTNLKVVFTLTDETERYFESGRIDSSLMKKVCPDFPDRQWWVCGSPAFVDGMIELAAKLKITKTIKSEDYPGY
jgi:ferredoxin-NADP reductase